jgi:ankyrin repeat protein
MGTRKNIKPKKSNKRFRNTRSKRQKGGMRNPGWDLYEASRTGNENEVRQLIPIVDNVDYTSPNTNNGTPLYISAQTNQIEILKLLLTAGADVNKQNGDGRTPIFTASASGHMGILIKLLATMRVDVNIPDNNGATPLIVASLNGNTKIVTILLGYGGDVNATLNGKTALHLAIEYEYPKIVEILAAAIETDLNRPNNNGATPLIIAILNGHLEIVKILLGLGADVNAKDSNGRTAFYLASETGHTEIVQLLEKNYREMKQQKLNDEIISQPQEVPSLSRLAANSLPPDVKSDYNAESGEFSLIDLNPRRLDKFGGKRKSKKSNRKTHKARRK